MADPISPFTPEMQAQIQQLIGLQTDRSARTAPIHQAAMAMAQRMAPGYAQSAMTAPSTVAPVRSTGGGITPAVSSGGGPGAGTTAAALFAAALLKPGSPLLAAIKTLVGGGGPGSGPVGGPASPGTFGKGPLGPGQVASPNSVGTPFDIADQGGPTDVRAIGQDQIQQLLRLIGGGNGFGSAREPGGAGGSAGETGYF